MSSPRPRLTAVFEAHHFGFRVTLRGQGGDQIAHEVGLSDRDVCAIVKAWSLTTAQIEILPAQP